ncbi:MAG TPA: Ig-like domain repeat protein [Terracidiphilus sp.]|nr:Ig-like domain repeat protein [Terracidiphilus sp.]
MARRVRVPSWNWMFLYVLGLSMCLGAASARAATLHVDTLSDTTHGTNDCSTGAASSCSLRDAITQATTDGNGDTISFNSSLNGGTIILGSALPAISVTVTISGPGANNLTISGAGSYQVFTIGTSGTPNVIISGLTVADGKTGNSGGAIAFYGDTLTVTDCAFSGNSVSSASSGGGGAIYSNSTLTVTGSTFSGNSAPLGGAILTSAGAATLTDNTFSGNSASTSGGAIYLASGAGAEALTNNTFSGNSASQFGGAVFSGSASTQTIENNIFSANTAGSGGGGAGVYKSGSGAVNASFNVYYQNLDNGTTEGDCDSCSSNTNAISATSNPLALPLGNYGGTTETFLPQPGSGAIGAGTSGATNLPTLDQRGFAVNDSSVDAGADQTNYIQVQAGTDAGAGVGDCPGASCTLRDAIAKAGAAGDIDFESSLNGSTITLTSGALSITAATGVSIVGPGANHLSVSGGGSSGVFTVASGATATLYGLTITGGDNPAGNGGAIDNSGTLALLDSAVSGNSAADGGGIGNESGGWLAIAGSTVSGNTGSSVGGGIYNDSTLTMTESTVSGNTDSTGGGGGIYQNSGVLTITDSTIAGNTDNGVGGGGINVGGSSSLILYNSIVAGNTTAGSGANIVNSYTTEGSVVGGSTNATTSELGGTGAAITLSPLQLNGLNAALQTMIPLPGSAAICAGKTSNVPFGTTTDERGYPLQPTGGYCTAAEVDAGAVQTNYTSIGFVQQPSNVNVSTDMSPAPTVQVVETDTLLTSNNTDAVNGVPITLTAAAGTLTGGTATSAAGLATFDTLQISPAEMDDTLSTAAVTMGSLTLPSVTSSQFNVLGQVTQLIVTGPGSATVGVPFSVTVTAEDAADNTISAYAGTVHFTTSDGGNGVVLPANYTFVPGTDHGTHTFTNAVTLATGGNQSVTATDTATGSITGSAPVTVNKATPTTTVTLTSGASPSNVDQSLTFTATVTPPAGTVPIAGSVAFSDNGGTIAACSSPVTVVWDSGTDKATAMCATAALTANGSPHTISAVYSGDGGYNTSSSSGSGNASQTVNKEATTVTMTPAGAAITVNGSVTFTATVAPNAGSVSVPFGATGTMQFTSNGTAITGCSAQSVNATTGVATCTTTTLLAGSDAIKAVFSGDLNYDPSPISSPTTQTVNKADTATTVALTAGANPSTVNNSVTFTATVTPFNASVALSGTVTFTDNGNPITNASNCGTAGVVNVNPSTGVATCVTSALGGGNHEIVATYGSDLNYNGSHDSVEQTMSALATVVAQPMLVSPTSPVVGNTVVVSAAVTPNPAPGTLNVQFLSTDTMTFFNGGTAIPSCTALTVTPSSTGATASCSISGLTANTYNITAQYNTGDSSYSQSAQSSALSLIIGKSALTVAVTSSPATVTVNQPVTFTATMAATQTLTGTVRFTDNSSPISGCTALMPSSTGVAACPDSSLAFSSTPHVIQATYSGDSNYSTSTGTLTGGETVNQGATTVTLTSSTNPTTVSQSVTFTATVTPNPTGATGLNGAVTFVDSATSAPIPGCSNLTLTSTGGAGQIACTTSALAVSPPPHTITATYAGDSNFSGSSSTFVQTVNPASSQITLSLSSPSPIAVNTLEVFTAAIQFPSGITSLLGTVTFTVDGSPISSCPPISQPAGNSVTCTVNSLGVGTHTIVAAYSGDPKFSVSNGTAILKVTPGQSSTVLTSSLNPAFTSNGNSSNYKDSVTFTAMVSAPAGATVALSNSGTVAFSGNGIPAACASVTPTAGVAICTATALPDGANNVVATYSGDPNYANSAGTVSQVIEDYSISVSGVPSNPLGAFVTQGSTTTNDVYPLSQAISVLPASISDFSASGSGVTLTCASSTPGAPKCNLASASLPIVAGTGVIQQADGIVIDASGSGVSPGTYSFTVTATDPTTSIVRTTTFPVTVRALSAALVIPSGATTNNSGTVTFSLPAGVTLSKLSCPYVAGTGITSYVETPAQIGMACTINGSVLGSSTSTGPQSVSVTVTVTTNGALSSAMAPLPPAGPAFPRLLAAGLLGLPLFGLIGLVRGRKSVRLSLFRMLAFLAIAVAAFQTIGCGGSFKSTATTVQGGTTPPGTYFLMIQGTGSDNNTYQAVLQVQVTLQ